MTRRRSSSTIALAALLVGLVGAAALRATDPDGMFGAVPLPPEVAAAAAALHGRLAAAPRRLAFAQERPEGFDPADWPEAGGCRGYRDTALARASLEPVRFAADGCHVTAGRWRDAYGGPDILDPSLAEVDRRVGPREAHASGGWAWDAVRRRAFMDDPADAAITTPAAARQRGALGPEAWMPASLDATCDHRSAWIAVKAAWGLATDAAEAAALRRHGMTCTGE